MILDISPESEQKDAGPAANVTLDFMLMQHSQTRGGALALVDSANRPQWSDAPPRQLDYRGYCAAVDAFATLLKESGLPVDSIIAIQLPPCIEAAIAIMGAIRAGMIAMPIPLLWRRAEAVPALTKVGARAVITTGLLSGTDFTSHIMDIAAECFQVRFVGAFGPNVSTDLVALDAVFSATPSPAFQTPIRKGAAADHVALITWDTCAKGMFPVARTHRELLAGGLGVVLETRLERGSRILNSFQPSSFAALTSGLIAGLITGGELHSHHVQTAEDLNQAMVLAPDLAVLPAPLLEGAQFSALAGPKKVMALWRTPERAVRASAFTGTGEVFDLFSFGETGQVVIVRGADRKPSPLYCGTVTAPRDQKNSPAVAEIALSAHGIVMMRGALVPSGFLPGTRECIDTDDQGWIETGYGARMDHIRGCMTVTTPPIGIIQVGGFRMPAYETDSWGVLSGGVEFAVLPDTVLGSRIVASARNKDQAETAFAAAGTTPLAASSIRNRKMTAAA